MTRAKTFCRWALGALLLFVGVAGLYDYATGGYDPDNAGIQLFDAPFRDLFNALMLSYVGVAIRIFHVIIGVLLFLPRTWWIGLLLHLPIAFHIFCIHLFYDLPPAHGGFFASGMFASLATFALVLLEPERLRALLVTQEP